MQEQARQNMVLFERAFAMFAPYAKLAESAPAPEKPAQAKADAGGAATSGEIAELKAQLSSMQVQLERLSKSASDKEQG
jgi:polyhydroxyalkanoate synthesis regulator protein